MTELVKKLTIPPEKRTEYDCKLMAKALYVFISSIAAFKDGLLVCCCCCYLAFCAQLYQLDVHIVSPASLIFEYAIKDFLERMPSQWPDMLRCRLWTTSRQYFRKVYIMSHTAL